MLSARIVSFFPIAIKTKGLQQYNYYRPLRL
jgi:hypothetical protein